MVAVLNKRARAQAMDEDAPSQRRRREVVEFDNGNGSDFENDSDLESEDSDAEEAPMGRKALLMSIEKKLHGAIEDDDDDEEDEEILDDEDELEFEMDDDQGADQVAEVPKAAFKNKQRVMILASRGITYRHRHLLEDLHALLPQSKKESKADSKTQLFALNELAYLNNCNNTLFFEARRHQDLYMWLSKTPNGPSVKFEVKNIHTMDELKLTGNHLKGSRPLVSFDANFETMPHLRLLKELLNQTFAVPRSSRKIKPFFDHVISFSILEDKIWFRNYQILEKDTHDKEVSLVEVGPRFVLDTIRIFDGSFCGSTLYENPEYVTPTAIRRAVRKETSSKYQSRQTSKSNHDQKMVDAQLEDDVLDAIFRG